jgi:hypothetical protein
MIVMVIKMITLLVFRLQLSFLVYSLHTRRSGKKFPNCGSIKLLGLFELNTSIVPFKLITFGVYTLPSSFLVLLEISLIFPFLDAVQHCQQFGFTVRDILLTPSL